MSYIESMLETATSRYSELYRGVNELTFFDFPDYPNVGDSAIALGQLAFFKKSHISVESAYCIGTLSRHALRTQTTAVINGGGNIAGFFPGIDRHRNRIAQELSSETVLIQAPQSIHFKTTESRVHFQNQFASRPNLRMAVRDAEAVSELSQILPNVLLAPDAVHHLGQIVCDDPTQKVIVLARRDQESSTKSQPEKSVDWKTDTPAMRRASSLRWKTKYLGPAGRLLNPSVGKWETIAQSRLSRGITTLSPGEIVVTDRLHAMLIALQMGRTVHAVDNNNAKLTKYANTWFGATNPKVKFFKSIGDALAATK